MNIEELELTADEAAKLVGVTPRHIRGLAADGTIERNGRGRYRAVALVRGILAAREAEQRRRSGGDAGNERDRLRTAILKQRLDGENGRMAAEARREAESIVDEASARLRAALASVAPRVTSNLDMRARIEAEINLALTTTADALAR